MAKKKRVLRRAEIDWRSDGLALALGIIAGLSLPQDPVSTDARLLASYALLRGLAIGAVAGMTLATRQPRWLPSAIGLTSGAVVGLVLGLMQPSMTGASVLGLVVLAVIATALFAWLRERIALVWVEVAALVLVVAIAITGMGLVPGTYLHQYRAGRVEFVAAPRIPEVYQFDGASYLRTYELMKQGKPYYPAFREALIGDKRHDESFISSRFNYREPFLFYLWKVLPGKDAGVLLTYFFLFSVAVMVAGYLLAASLVAPGPALLAPLFMGTYFFFFWWENTWFMFSEIWAAGFAVIALMCLVRKWRISSLVFLTAAVASREFLILLVPAWIVAWWFLGEHKRYAWFAAVAAVVPATVLGAHLIAAPSPTGGGVGLGISTWLHGGVARLVEALRFGGGYLLGPKVTPLLFPVAALVGAWFALPVWRRWTLLVALALPLVFLLVFSFGPDANYWGGFFVPIAIALAPSALAPLAPAPESGLGVWGQPARVSA